MQNEETYTISRSINIKINAQGSLVITNSVSRSSMILSDTELTLLRNFAIPRSLSQVYEHLSAHLSIDTRQFKQIITQFIEKNIITFCRSDFSSTKGYFAATDAFASPTTHHWMLRDAIRVNAYRTAIFKHAKDKIVVDMGCGTGILSIFASQAGAQKVFAIEESEIAILAQQMLEANQVTDKISLLFGNSMDITLPEPAELIVHEILGVDPFFENIIPYIKDARSRFLKKGGILLPHKVEVYCIGLESEFIPSIAQRAQLEAREFAGMYQVNFDPYLELLSTIDEIDERSTIPRRSSDFREAVFQQPILSDECLLRSVDLYGDLDEQVATVMPAKMHIHTSGRLGSILLFFRAFLDDEIHLSTSPYTPRTHWGWSIRDLSKIIDVKPGEEINLFSQLTEVQGRQKLKINLA